MREGPREHGRRHPPDVRRQVGQFLRTPVGRTPAAREPLAASFHVTPRTLRTWAAMADRTDPPPRIGRKPHDPAEQRFVQGKTAGWRPIVEALQAAVPPVPTRLIQEELARQKTQERRAERERQERYREGHQVLAKNAVWCEDEALLGHADGERVHGEVVRDVASSMTLRVSVGSATTAEAVIAQLEQVAAERGAYPLVWQRDNGPAYGASKVDAFLALHFITALRSRTYTSTDNPAAEHANRELKEESGLDAPVALSSVAEAAGRLETAQRRLDEGRLRATRGWKTAARFDAELPEAERLVDRAAFYAAARSAVEAAVLGIEAPRARRKAERDAIWKTLETYGLARRHLGARRTPNPRRPLTESAVAARIPL
jgi:transposase InsO family protein